MVGRNVRWKRQTPATGRLPNAIFNKALGDSQTPIQLAAVRGMA